MQQHDLKDQMMWAPLHIVSFWIKYVGTTQQYKMSDKMISSPLINMTDMNRVGLLSFASDWFLYALHVQFSSMQATSFSTVAYFRL